MENTKKRTKIMLIVSIALMLVCGIAVYAIQTHTGKVTMKELNIETDAGYSMSAYLFIPNEATSDNPAPAIVVSHGYLNNKEMTDANYVELARRGYVVLAIDQPDHGDSEVTETFELLAPNGVYEGVLALSRMPFVDTEKIGITGHSMGSWSCNAAIAADNAADTQLISAALIHCNDAVYTDNDGNYVNIYGSRPVGIISAVYDEFFGKSVNEEGKTLDSPYYMESAGAQSFLNFGTDPEGLKTRNAFKYYTDTVDGIETFRVIYRPSITHAWSHFSARSESYIIDFFEKALGAPNSIDSNNQIWQWKEAFNFLGLIGFVLFICSFGAALLWTPTFESLGTAEIVKPMQVSESRGKIWFWLTLVAGLVFGTVAYLPIMAKGSSLPVSQVMPMGMGLWSTFCGLFTILCMVIYYHAYGKKNGMDLTAVGIKMPLKKLGLSVLLAVIVIVVAYGCVFIADYFFFADFRIWVVAIKAFEVPMLKLLPYLFLFCTYYIAVSVATNCFNYNTIGGKFNGIICSVFAAGPAILMVAIQYATYFMTKSMRWPQASLDSPNYPMFILGMFSLIPVLLVTTLITRFFYKRTKNPYIAGIINAVIVGMFTITNTCTTV